MVKIDALEAYKQEYRWVAINKGPTPYTNFMQALSIEEANLILVTKKKRYHHNKRLTKDKIEHVRELLKGDLQIIQIAEVAGVSTATVSQINKGRHWSCDAGQTEPTRQTKDLGPSKKI